MEYDFKSANIALKIETTAETESGETSFSEIPLSGRLDAIFVNEANGTLTLMDYKTGDIQTENKMKGATQDGDGKYFRQMIFYKILADLDDRLLQNGYKAEKLTVEFA